MAEHLARRGVKVALLDILEEKTKGIAEEIKRGGGDAMAIKVDVLDKHSISAAKVTLLKQFGRIDILINGARENKREATTSDEISFFDMPADAL